MTRIVDGMSVKRGFCRVAVMGMILLMAGVVGGQPTAFFPVDLSRFSKDTNGFGMEAWAALPRGMQTFEGVPFRLDGRVEVTGMTAARNGDFLAPRAMQIPVGRKATRLYFLLGAIHAEKDGVPVAKVVMHYANGEERSLRLAYGVHLRAASLEHKEKVPALADPNAKVVWTGITEDAERSGATIRLFRTILENPLPEQEIISLDIVSLFSKATPLIAALTAEENGLRVSEHEASSRHRLARKAYEFEDSAYAGQFTVRTVDAQTGAPLTNAVATLSITDDENSFYFGEAKADGDGRLTLDYPPQHTVAYNLLIKAPGHTPLSLGESRLKTRQFQNDLTARLLPGVRVGGVVQDQRGQPVAGAEVVVHQVTQDGPRQYTRIDYDSVVTGRDGKWSSAAVPADFAGFSFQVSHPDYRAALFTDARGTGSAKTLSREELLARTSVLKLEPGLRVRSLVSDSDGQPVPKAEIYLQTANNPQPRRLLATDATGQFSIAVTEPGEAAVFILAKGFAPKFQPVSLDAEQGPVGIVLSKARALTGFVRDQYQQPIVGAVLKVDSWHDTSLLRWRGSTDERGHFAWEGAPEDSVLLFISKTNHSSTRVMLGGSSGETTFMLQKRSQAFGSVVDVETGQPIPEFRIIRGRAYSAFEPMRWERYNYSRGRNGQFSIVVNDYYGSEGRSQLLIEAPGYLPQTSPAYTNAGWHSNHFALQKGKGISGVVKSPDGQPVARATVVLVDKSENAYMDRPGEFQRNSSVDSVMTGPNGHFEFQPRLDAHTIFATHAEGFGRAGADQVASNGVIALQPWGRVKGLLRVGEKPEANQTIDLQNYYPRYGEEGRNGSALSVYLKTETGPDGSFVFDKVPPGERRVYLHYNFRDRQPGPTPLSHGTLVTVLPGQTAEVTVGGLGRPVVGQVRLTAGGPEDVDWRRDVHTLSAKLPQPPGVEPMPAPANLTPDQQRQFWRDQEQRQRAFWNSPEGRALDRTQRSYVLVFATNGSFRADSVPPGEYTLQISPTDPEQEYYNYQRIGTLAKDVTIPAAPSERPNEPFDLGTLDLAIRAKAKMGVRAPPFEATTFDGKTVRLEDYRGKFVLLDFWATWAGPRPFELTALTNLYKNYAASNRLVMISLNLDHQRKVAEDFLKTNSLPWLQCYLGPWGDTTVPATYGVEGLPAAILVDPQGKISARNPRVASLQSTIRRLLSLPRPANAVRN